MRNQNNPLWGPVIFVAGQWVSQHAGVPAGRPLWNEVLALLTRSFYQFPDRFRLEELRGRPPYNARLYLPTGDMVDVRLEPLTEAEAERCLRSPHYGPFSVVERDRAAADLWTVDRWLAPEAVETAIARSGLGPGDQVEAAMVLGLTGWEKRR